MKALLLWPLLVFGASHNSILHPFTIMSTSYMSTITVTMVETHTVTMSPSSSRSSHSASHKPTVPIYADPTSPLVTEDGTCGPGGGGRICGDWPRGSCCSKYGFCGNSSAHCGSGCQSGPCVDPASNVPFNDAGAPKAADGGRFEVIGDSGVPAMHAALMQNGRVVFLDKVENFTHLSLPDGRYAYSSEVDLQNVSAKPIPLQYGTNAFCSGGTFLGDGRLLSIGGNAPLSSIDATVGDGFKGLRYLARSATDPSLTGQSWEEPGNKLNSPRWYASAQILSDGKIFVASGSLNGLDPSIQSNNNPTFEILSSTGITSGQSVPMDILTENQPYYMYPMIHLLRDGSLFVFVSKSAEKFNPVLGKTVEKYPDLPGMHRTYPSTGGSVILPFSSANSYNPDVVVCGGGAYQAITSPTDATCGRINPLVQDAHWDVEAMPEGRVMVEGTLLPDGTVVWLNGGSMGAQGFGIAGQPALDILLYDPDRPLGERFSTGAASTIPRLYHSVALLDLDGTVIVAGSNPVEQPVLAPSATNPYVTEFRIERYTPPYLAGKNADRRPENVRLSSTKLQANAMNFYVQFDTPMSISPAKVVLYHGGFVTHSLHMGQRMIYLDSSGYFIGAKSQALSVSMPPDSAIAPPGPYVIYVVQDGVPSIGKFVSVEQ